MIDKFVSRITPIDNGHYRWDLNFAPGPKQAIIGCIEGRKGKATVEIKEYGENDEHSHRTYDRSIQFSSNGTIAYFCLIAACAERYSGRTFWTTAPYPSNRLAYDPNDNFPPFLTLHIGFQEAEKYRKQSGSYLRKNQWEDLTIDVYL